MEIDRRAAKLSTTELQKSHGSQTSGHTDSESIKEQTRYSYYRKQKVLEYINFINTKYFIDNAVDISSSTYDIDRRYIEVLGNESNYVLTVDDKGETAINDQIIDKVANSLAIASQYICKLRGRLKLQA